MRPAASQPETPVMMPATISSRPSSPVVASRATKTDIVTLSSRVADSSRR
jgi:hypothetical protein